LDGPFLQHDLNIHCFRLSLVNLPATEAALEANMMGFPHSFSLYFGSKYITNFDLKVFFPEDNLPNFNS
jgi:hypothetical protein